MKILKHKMMLTGNHIKVIICILVHYLSQTVMYGTLNLCFSMSTHKHKYGVFSNLLFG